MAGRVQILFQRRLRMAMRTPYRRGGFAVIYTRGSVKSLLRQGKRKSSKFGLGILSLGPPG
jgi:hypothetical protein